MHFSGFASAQVCQNATLMRMAVITIYSLFTTNICEDKPASVIATVTGSLTLDVGCYVSRREYKFPEKGLVGVCVIFGNVGYRRHGKKFHHTNHTT